jgi:hypothetical protein
MVSIVAKRPSLPSAKEPKSQTAPVKTLPDSNWLVLRGSVKRALRSARPDPVRSLQGNVQLCVGPAWDDLP